MVMIKQCDLLTDEMNGGLIKFTVQGDGSVFGHLASGPFSKVIFQVLWTRTDTFHIISEAFKGALTGGSVFSIVIDIPDPAIEGFI